MYVLWMKYAKRCYISDDYRKIAEEIGMDLVWLRKVAAYGYYEDDRLVLTREEVL